MAEIAGVTIDFTDYLAPGNPRIVHIPNTVVAATVQDVLDTVAAKQAELDNLIYDALYSAGGKEELSDILQVGITLTLLNARVSFDAVKTSTVEGAVTTGDTNGVTLNDLSGMFIANAVQPGAWIWNKTDGSACSVLRVVSETQLITDGLGDGIDNQFDVSDLYEIRNVQPRDLDGGNITSLDSVGDRLRPVIPTAGTQAQIAQSSSATLVDFGGVTAVVDAVWDEPLAAHIAAGSAGKALSDTDLRAILLEKFQRNRLELTDGTTNNWVLYDDDDVTPLVTWSVADKNGATIIQPGTAPSRRTRGV